MQQQLNNLRSCETPLQLAIIDYVAVHMDGTMRLCHSAYVGEAELPTGFGRQAQRMQRVLLGRRVQPLQRGKHILLFPQFGQFLGS